MSEPAPKSVLSRKAAQARARRPRATSSVDLGPKPARAMVRAIKRAGMSYVGLEAEPRDETVAWDQSLAEVTEALPEGGLLVVLEGEDRQRGIMHLHQGLLDALIEVQTTGTVDTVSGPARPATQIDAALSRDYVDLLLSGFESELDELGITEIASGLRYGTILNDRRQMPLLLPEKGFHLLRSNLDIAEGKRLAAVLVALPGSADATAATAGDAAQDPAWRAEFHTALSHVPLSFTTVLFRARMDLKEVLALKPGDTIPFAPDMLDGAKVEDARGRMVMRGRLGQSGGRRALRLSIGAVNRPAGEDANVPGAAAASPMLANFGDGPTAKRPEPGAPPDLSMTPMTEAKDLVSSAPSQAAGQGGAGEGAMPQTLPPRGDPDDQGPADPDGLPPLGESGLPPLGAEGLPALEGEGLPELPKPV